MKTLLSSLSLLTLFATAPTYAALVTYDESFNGDLPSVADMSINANLGTLDSGAVIIGTLLGTDTRDSISFNSPRPFRVVVDSFSGPGVLSFGFGPAFPTLFPDGFARAFLPGELLYDGIGRLDSSVAAPTGILVPGEYRFDFGPESGELSSYQVTIAAIPEPSAALLGILLTACLAAKRRR